MLFSSNFSVVVVGHRLDTFSQKKKHISTHHLLCLVSISLSVMFFVFFSSFFGKFSHFPVIVAPEFIVVEKTFTLSFVVWESLCGLFWILLLFLLISLFALVFAALVSSSS